jgi:small nuclear ribonucleoprotein (snRNP)-like protein
MGMMLRILPDELSILTDLIGREVVFVLTSGKEVTGRLRSVNKDTALLVSVDGEKETRNYVKLNCVAMISRVEVLEGKLEGKGGSEG